MRILLRDTRTGLYATGTGGWTTNPDEAFAFETGAAAIDFEAAKHFHYLEVLFSFDDPALDLHISINEVADATHTFSSTPASLFPSSSQRSAART